MAALMGKVKPGILIRRFIKETLFPSIRPSIRAAAQSARVTADPVCRGVGEQPGRNTVSIMD